MSEKFDRFKEALEALCREHSVHLSTTDYDALAVFDLRDGEYPLCRAGIEDETSATPDK